MTRHLRLLVFVLAFCASCATQTPTFFDAPNLLVPQRTSQALLGSTFGRKIILADEQSREQAIIEQYLQGNVPDYLRTFSKVRFISRTRSGKQAEVTIWVLPDYLSVGSDRDFLRTPMTPISAQIIADQYDLALPTVKIVDAIYQAAGVKLDPRPFKPGPGMVTVAELIRHNKVIQISLHDQVPPGLVAGHKKDIVISNMLLRKPNRVAIYGWHLRSGSAIQPLTTVHGSWYADYSHGVRLMAKTMVINNVTHKVADVLKDPELSALISYEGSMKTLRYDINQVVRKKWWPQS